MARGLSVYPSDALTLGQVRHAIRSKTIPEGNLGEVFESSRSSLNQLLASERDYVNYHSLKSGRLNEDVEPFYAHLHELDVPRVEKEILASYASFGLSDGAETGNILLERLKSLGAQKEK